MVLIMKKQIMIETQIFYTDTGGSSWYSDIGFKLNVKKLLLTSNVQFAFENNLNGINQLVPKARLIIGLNYLLK